MRSTFLVAGALLLGSCLQAAPKQLQIYFVDVEGGQSTLFVTPAGQSLLIDTGWPGNAARDANRITAVAKLAKIKKIDYVLITHYHDDHVGGVPQLIEKIPVGTFIVHGPNTESGAKPDALFNDYLTASAKSRHITVKPGDKLPINGIDGVVVSSNGDSLNEALPGAGQPNSACSGVEQKRLDKSENARSLGVLLTFGKLRIVDLGDLTWNKELDLVCPNNKLGKVDLYIVSHHGLAASSSPALVHGIQPRLAIMDNATTKGGAPQAWEIIKSSPGLEDLWQLHVSEAGGKDHNVAENMIANTASADTGYYLRVAGREDGSMEVFNPRNKFSKKYPAK
jgi:competence protein ComEC